MQFLFNFLSFSLILGWVQSLTGPLLLSEYIKQNRLSEAKSLSEVKGLPNAPKIQSYSGFLTVDHKYNSNLFFWFFPSFKCPDKAPVVLWLEGGPGDSSLWSLLVLNGPFIVHENLTLTLNPYALTQEFSVLYIDNPVGTGFSFTDDERGFSTDQNSVADNLYIFLEQFFQIFSEYRDLDFYLSGESYAGKYVPILGYKLMKMSKESGINFKGVAIGNGLIDPPHMLDHSVYLKSTGLIDKKQQDYLKLIEDRVRHTYQAGDYHKASLYFMHLYFNRSSTIVSYSSQFTGYDYYYSFVESHTKIVPPYYALYLNMSDTREAIHVDSVPYTDGNETVFEKLSSDIIIPRIDELTALILHYKVMLFVGNFDMLVGTAQTDSMLENKEWKYYLDYYLARRVIWKVARNDTEVAGYAKSFGCGKIKFTVVVVRNARHQVALDQPRAYLDLMKRFIYDRSFDNNERVLVSV